MKYKDIYNLIFTGNVFGLISFKLLRSLDKITKQGYYKYKINGYSLRFPINHLLPQYRLIYPSYSENIGTLMRSLRKYIQRIKFVDIGANIGDSYAICKKYADFDYLGIEGDLDFFKYMKSNIPSTSKSKMVNVYVGDNKKEILIHNKQDGTGSLVKKYSETSKNKASTQPLINVLRKYKFTNPDLIKSDTDGYDIKILSSYLKHPQKTPVLFFEYDPLKFDLNIKDIKTFLKLLIRKKYKYFVIFDNYGSFLRTYSNKNIINCIKHYDNSVKKRLCDYFDIAAFPSNYQNIYQYYIHGYAEKLV